MSLESATRNGEAPARSAAPNPPSSNHNRSTRKPGIFPVLGLGLSLLLGCLSRSLTGLTVLPAAGSVSVAVGQTSQFQAQAAYTESGHATTSKNLTDQVTWVSSNTAVATISATGLATAVALGTATITGSMQGSFGPVSASSTITVTAPSTGTTGTSLPRVLTSLAVIPGSQAVSATGETAQFIAIGTYSSGSPATADVTDQVSWRSSDVSVAQVSSSGLVTAVGGGQTTITALATSSDGSVTSASGSITATATATSGAVTLPTLTVYKVGSGTGTVQGYSVSGGKVGVAVINCGTGAGCTGNFPLGTQVMLVPSADQGSVFDGWSANCTVPPMPSSYYPNSCSVVLNANDTIGAIFDPTP